jgi:hypothetical protein
MVGNEKPQEPVATGKFGVRAFSATFRGQSPSSYKFLQPAFISVATLSEGGCRRAAHGSCEFFASKKLILLVL